MSENRNVLVVQRAQQTVGHLLRLLVESRVHAGDHHIHLFQHRVGEIELAIGQDVHFDARHDGDAVGLLVGGTNARNVLLGTLVIEAVGERQVFGVIGDGDVLVAALFGRRRHLVNGALSVGFDGMHVHFAAQVFHA